MQFGKIALVVAFSAAFSSAAAGCSLDTRPAVRYVQYDFSDYATYDKPFAASPSYRAPANAAMQEGARGLAARSMLSDSMPSGSLGAVDSSGSFVDPSRDAIEEVRATEFGTVSHE